MPLTAFGAGEWIGSRPAGNTDALELTPALVQPAAVEVDGRYRFEVQVRRTAGAGSVTLAVPESIGG